MRMKRCARPGTSAVEFAVVAPAALTLIFAIIVGGLAVFRFQEIATLAREAARYASVHGTEFARATGQTAATPQSIYDNVIATKAVGLDLSQLTYSVTWNTDNRPVRSVIVGGVPVGIINTVTVSITYQWLPEAFFGGSSTMTSTSTQIMTF